MKVVVLIVTYNPKKWIDSCFLSLRNSSIPLEIIVIDNGSTDGSQEIILKNYPEVDFIQSNENLGFGKANNIGIEKAYNLGADYFFLLNQDAWVDIETIEKLAKSNNEYPEYGILSPIHMNGKGTELDFGFKRAVSNINFKNENNEYSKPVEVLFVNAAIWLMSRKCIEIVGGFSPVFFHYSEDDNYVQRLNYHGFKIGILPGVKGCHDREFRGENVFFSNLYQVFERDIIMTLSNPILNISYFKILVANTLGLVFNILKQNSERDKNRIYLKALLNINRKKILLNRKLSRKLSNAFLNLKP